MSDFDVWSYLAKMGVKLRPVSDPFFMEGNAVCQMQTCQYVSQVDTEEFLHHDYEQFPCTVPGCKAVFTQLLDHEAHYNSLHRHSCNTCHKMLPSSHLLELHVIETHDTYFTLLAEKKPSYECYLEQCKEKFWNPPERREHCISVHKFPPDFRFEAKKSKQKRKPKPTAPKTSQPSNKNGSCGNSSRKSSAGSQMSSPDKPMEIEAVTIRETPKKRESPRKSKPRPYSAIITSELKDKSPPTPRVQSARSPSKEPSGINRRSLIPTTPQTSRRFSLVSGSPEKNRERRDLSLCVARPKEPNGTATSAPTSPTKSPSKRPPLSLARMGERLSKSRNSVLLLGSAMDISMTEVDDFRGESTSPRSLHSASQSTLKPLNANSPAKPSRIPVRSFSYRMPKNITFGSGVQKTFQRRSSARNWHQRANDDMMDTTTNIERTDMNDLKMALP